MNVAAWPRCVASYGVMPQVYIVTSSPGSNGTISRFAVSYRRIGLTRCSFRRNDGIELDPRELRRDAGLVAHVELQHHRGERLDRHRVGQLAGVEPSAAGDARDDLADDPDRILVV